MEEQQTTPLRVYGGVAGDDRQVERRALLIEAGLDLLGAADGEPDLTVRGVCKQSGLVGWSRLACSPDCSAGRYRKPTGSPVALSWSW